MANIETKLQIIVNPTAIEERRRMLRDKVVEIIGTGWVVGGGAGGGGRDADMRGGVRPRGVQQKHSVGLDARRPGAAHAALVFTHEAQQAALRLAQQAALRLAQQAALRFPTSREPAPHWIFTYDQASTGIRLSISEKAGELGMCSGIITSGFLAKDTIEKDDFIVVAYSKGQGTVPYNTRYGSNVWRFSGFATCNFKYDWLDRKTLYINVLCANLPGVAQKIMKMVICKIGKELADGGLISAIQLSSLTYVIGYYYKKWGFRFYNSDKPPNRNEYNDVNHMVPDLPRIGPEIELEADLEDIDTWDEAAMMQIPGIAEPLAKLQKLQGLVTAATGPSRKQLRRSTLGPRLEAMRNLIKEWRKQVHAAQLHASFMQKASQFSRQYPKGYKIMLRTAQLKEKLGELDPGGEGWTMLLPQKKWNITRRAWVAEDDEDDDEEGDAAMAADEYAPSIATVCAAARKAAEEAAARKAAEEGGGRKKRRKSKRLKKGTRKKALKKRHRRRRKRTKRPKRRRRTRRRRRRRRRRTRR